MNRALLAVVATAGVLGLVAGCGQDENRTIGPPPPLAVTSPPLVPSSLATSAPPSPVPSSSSGPGASTTRSTAGKLVPAPAPREAGDDDYPAALEAARAWVESWCRPPEGTPTADWVTRVKEHLYPENWALLEDIEPQNIASTHVTGPAQAISTHPGAVVADVPTDDEPVRVTLIHWEGKWLVNGWN